MTSLLDAIMTVLLAIIVGSIVIALFPPLTIIEPSMTPDGGDGST
jgi:hypothetical protein